MCWDPAQQAAPYLAEDAAALLRAHGRERWDGAEGGDGEGGAWGEQAAFSAVGFQERAR